MEKILVIGERIHTNRKVIAGAVEAKDTRVIKQEAIDQVSAGAEMVAVNAATFHSEEPECLKWLVRTVQEAVDVPLCIDSTNPTAMSEALSVHRGRALLNSITAQEERISGMAPLIKKYKCDVVALCMDDAGIPDTADERFKVASLLITKLRGEDLTLDGIYIDPLLMPISIDGQYGKIALNTIERVTQTFEGVHTICGLSNISTGLPLRKRLNHVFLVMALAKGLDTIIMDTCDQKLMANLVTAKALLGHDEYCLKYINAYRQDKLD